MTKYAKDPELNTLANQLKVIEWEDPLTEPEQDSVQELTSDPGARRRLVSPLPNFITWAVRIYLGGEQRTIGLVDNKNVGTAFRFADMAQQYFWKYRVRGACPPVDRDLNFSRDRLNHDMQFEHQALGLLKHLEEYLLKSGAIKSAADRIAEKAKKKASRMTIASTVRVNHMELKEELEGLHRGVADCARRADLERLERLVQILIDNQHRPAPSMVPNVWPPQITYGTTGEPITVCGSPS